MKKLEIKPLERILRSIEEKLSIIRDAPDFIAKRKAEAEAFRSKAAIESDDDLKRLRMLMDKADIAAALPLRAANELDMLNPRAIEAIEVFLQLWGVEADAERAELLDRVRKALLPFCRDEEHALQLAQQTSVLHRVPDRSRDERPFFEGIRWAVPEGSPDQVAAFLSQALRGLLKTYAGWEKAGGRFVVV